MQMPAANRLSCPSLPRSGRGSREGDQLGLTFTTIHANSLFDFTWATTRRKNRSEKVPRELSHTEGIDSTHPPEQRFKPMTPPLHHSKSSQPLYDSLCLDPRARAFLAML